MHSDHLMLSASFGDGHIMIFDHSHRALSSPARFMAFGEHKQMVLAFEIQENDKLESGCTDEVYTFTSLVETMMY